MISHIELRSEESIDVRPYVHQRKIEKVVVSLDGEIKEIRNAFLNVTIIALYITDSVYSFLFRFYQGLSTGWSATRSCMPLTLINYQDTNCFKHEINSGLILTSR